MEVLQHPWLNDPNVLTAGAISLLVIIFLGIWLRIRAKHKYQRQLHKLVKKVAVDFRQNIYLPDGLGESVFIDYLILSHHGIIVLNVQNYPGILFGGDNVDLWTQVDNHKSYKFENPLPYNEICVQSIKQFASNAPVHGQVVFTHAGEFPKGKPDGVSLTNELMAHIDTLENFNVIPDSLKLTWDKLIACGARNSNSVIMDTTAPLKH